MKGALVYNERKVSDGRAVLLHVAGYAKDPDQLRFDEKLFRLQDLADRNLRTKTSSVHISLNFPVEENLKKSLLVDIADAYMRGIGFANQPYLVYQHFDAGHPHIHILTTNIDRHGKRISLHNLGRTKSEATRKTIELEMGLQQTQGKTTTIRKNLSPVIYGQSATKSDLEETVRLIAGQYRFGSMPEFNAALQQFNVLADRGSETSVMYKHKGLRYWVTDQKGNKIGVPLKSSSLKGKPTLNMLEKRFKLNVALRMVDKENVRMKVDEALKCSKSMAEFKCQLSKRNVYALIRRTEVGKVYGLTIVDNEFKTVFKGSDLGKLYSATAIATRFENMPRDTTEPVLQQDQRMDGVFSSFNNPDPNDLINALMSPVKEHDQIPSQLRPKKKKKRRLHL